MVRKTTLETEYIPVRCIKEKEITRMDESIKSMSKKVDEIHRHIIGNGRAGLLERVSNLEVGSRVTYAIIGVAIAIASVLVAIL
jgi:hypothetical protein